MALVDFDKFLAAFITAMKECSQMRNFSIPRCIKKALVDQGLDYKGGEIIKTQCRVSAEAKENGYGESEDERIRKDLIAIFKGQVPFTSKEDSKRYITWLEKQGQKSAEWHKEDEQNLNACLGYIPDEFLRRWLTDIIHANYDKSDWNEKDEKMCQETIDWFEKKCFPYALESENPARESIKWLKSLKTRYTWKPSDEQIHILSWIANVKLGDSVVEQEVSKHLNELCEDLKKL